MDYPIDWQELLARGIKSLGMSVTVQQFKHLLNYVAHLQKWNKTYNLTAIRDPLDMLKLHVLDSLSIIPHLQKYKLKCLIDVGTGAGLPGVVLAILWPQCDVHLLDANGKKTRFLVQCKHLLQLDNVTVLHKRVEQHLPNKGYDMVLSRAFAAISDMLQSCNQLINDDGLFAAMKGTYPERELMAMPSQYKIKTSYVLQLPDLDLQRHLLIIDKH